MWRAGLCICFLAACRAKSAPDAGVAAPSASASIAVIEAAAPEVDLLWATDAKVAVSSRVANAHDKPEHLVDHRPDTAWNGRTGDLVGAWIQVRVPADAKVNAIAITAGFDKKTDKEDLFTENHRISKLRITHDGTSRDVDLDASVRTPQRIEIGAGGGDYRIEVRAVTAGTKPSWRELCVSELAVLGTTPRPNASPHAPPVLIGALEKTVDYTPSDWRGETWDAACAKYIADENADIAQIGQETQVATCVVGAKKPGKGAILETARVHLGSGIIGLGRPAFDGDVIGIRTTSGAVIMDLRVSGIQRTVNPSTDYRATREEWSGDDFVVDAEAKTTTWEDGHIEPDPEDGAVVDHGPWFAIYANHVVCSSASGICKGTQTKKE